MRKTKFQRITALMLALVFLLCGGVVSAAAESASTTDVKTSDIKDLLNLISYNEYAALNAGVPQAESAIVIDATKNYTYVNKAGEVYTENTVIPEGVDKSNVTYVGEFEGINALYTPANGTVTWSISGITTATKYSLEIEYYSIVNKSAPIERIFKINNSVPFSEARSLSLSKTWSNVYNDGKFELPEGESAESYISAAASVGITARESVENGKTYIKYTMPEYWTAEASDLLGGFDANGKVDADKVIRFFENDIDKNEIRASLTQHARWATYTFKDANGFLQESFEFVLTPNEKTGEVTISLEGVSEPVVISKINLVPHETPISYEKYLEAYANEPAGEGSIKIEAEYFSATSSQTIYPISDTTSAASSPAATNRTVLNTIGGEKWQTSGQWAEYKFKVSSSGMYSIMTRFMQSVLDGMYTSRMLLVYSDNTLSEGDKGYYNGVPFEEAANLQFGYSSDWQSGKLNDGSEEFDLYFAKDVVYTIRFEVTLGNMGDIVRRVEKSLVSINADYLNIIKLTGTIPDEYRDYGFSRVMPDTMIDLIRQARELKAVSEEIAEIAGEKSSTTATLDKIVRVLDIMGKNDDEVAKNLEQLKTYIGTLGTWVSTAKTQPLTLDYIVVQSAADENVPKAKAGFFEALWYEFSGFIQSFFRNYDRMGAMVDTEDIETVEVWLAYGRDQSQVVRSLINSDFTPNSGIVVDLKLVVGGTLLPSILSGNGPDVYIGIGQGDVINYAIRGALMNIEHLEGFDDACADFNEAAMIVLGIEDADKNFHYYGLPETQGFSMMFVREDILADLNIDIPRTWEDLKEAVPILQANNMEIGMPKDSNIFLYQSGGELFADDGMRINLDSNVALDSFNTMCEMFTMYSFPIAYDFANRFRTGEMPIGIADYTGAYNQLKVFATEIEGLWGFYPLPGVADEEGNINNVAVSGVSAICMINGCDNIEDSWEFMKWHVDDQCQIEYSNEMVAILGPSAKHPTANMSALASLPWTAEEYEQISLQFNSLASIPNYPGAYIIGRYTSFAFLAAYNEKADPVTEIQSYIKIINAEITHKREEFGLETLKDGQTLAEKRMEEAEQKLFEARESSAYSSAYDDTYNNIVRIIAGYSTKDYASIRALADRLESLNADLFGAAVSDLRSAANALESYEAYR